MMVEGMVMMELGSMSCALLGWQFCTEDQRWV